VTVFTTVTVARRSVGSN